MPYQDLVQRLRDHDLPAGVYANLQHYWQSPPRYVFRNNFEQLRTLYKPSNSQNLNFVNLTTIPDLAALFFAASPENEREYYRAAVNNQVISGAKPEACAGIGRALEERRPLEATDLDAIDGASSRYRYSDIFDASGQVKSDFEIISRLSNAYAGDEAADTGRAERARHRLENLLTDDVLEPKLKALAFADDAAGQRHKQERDELLAVLELRRRLVAVFANRSNFLQQLGKPESDFLMTLPFLLGAVQRTLQGLDDVELAPIKPLLINIKADLVVHYNELAAIVKAMLNEQMLLKAAHQEDAKTGLLQLLTPARNAEEAVANGYQLIEMIQNIVFSVPAPQVKTPQTPVLGAIPILESLPRTAEASSFLRKNWWKIAIAGVLVAGFIAAAIFVPPIAAFLGVGAITTLATGGLGTIGGIFAVAGGCLIAGQAIAWAFTGIGRVLKRGYDALVGSSRKNSYNRDTNERGEYKPVPQAHEDKGASPYFQPEFASGTTIKFTSVSGETLPEAPLAQRLEANRGRVIGFLAGLLPSRNRQADNPKWPDNDPKPPI